jgi:hypothetical protein
LESDTFNSANISDADALDSLSFFPGAGFPVEAVAANAAFDTVAVFFLVADGLPSMSEAAGFLLATLFADACDGGADASELILPAARLLSSAMIAFVGAGGVLRGRPRLRVTTSADIIRTKQRKL